MTINVHEHIQELEQMMQSEGVNMDKLRTSLHMLRRELKLSPDLGIEITDAEIGIVARAIKKDANLSIIPESTKTATKRKTKKEKEQEEIAALAKEFKKVDIVDVEGW